LRELLWRDFRNKLLSRSGVGRLDSFRRARWSLRLGRIARCPSKTSPADPWPFRSHPRGGQNQTPVRLPHRLSSPTAPMISDPEFFRSFGFELEIEPVAPDFLIESTPARDFLGLELEVLEVPGHCPASR